MFAAEWHVHTCSMVRSSDLEPLPEAGPVGTLVGLTHPRPPFLNL